MGKIELFQDVQSEKLHSEKRMTYSAEAAQAHLERLRVKAKNEIGEKEELIPGQIAQVRAIIEADSSLVNPPEWLDHFVLRCLRARKYNIERAAKTYKKLATLHTNLTGITEELVPSKGTELLRKRFGCVLKSRDSLGRHIIYIRAEKWNPYKFSLDAALASLFLTLDQALESIDTQLHGLVILVDLKGLGFAHARQIGPSRIQAVASILQDAYPARFKEIHFFNHPAIFNMVFAVAKPFLKEKIRKRIYFHGHDLDSVHKSFNSAILPESIGGKLIEDEAVDQDLVTKLLKRDEYYKDFLQIMKLT